MCQCALVPQHGPWPSWPKWHFPHEKTWPSATFSSSSSSSPKLHTCMKRMQIWHTEHAYSAKLVAQNGAHMPTLPIPHATRPQTSHLHAVIRTPCQRIAPPRARHHMPSLGRSAHASCKPFPSLPVPIRRSAAAWNASHGILAQAHAARRMAVRIYWLRNVRVLWVHRPANRHASSLPPRVRAPNLG